MRVDVLTDLAERRTVVVVTHRPELVERADRHVTLTREGAEDGMSTHPTSLLRPTSGGRGRGPPGHGSGIA